MPLRSLGARPTKTVGLRDGASRLGTSRPPHSKLNSHARYTPHSHAIVTRARYYARSIRTHSSVMRVALISSAPR